jgi:hypothetical protein
MITQVMAAAVIVLQQLLARNLPSAVIYIFTPIPTVIVAQAWMQHHRAVTAFGAAITNQRRKIGHLYRLGLATAGLHLFLERRTWASYMALLRLSELQKSGGDRGLGELGLVLIGQALWLCNTATAGPPAAAGID